VRILLLVSAPAGGTEPALLRAAVDGLSAGAEVERVDVGGAADLARALARRSGRRLVLAGGDGSLHHLLQALHDRDELAAVGPLGLLPLGTGNDLARAAGLPLDPAAAGAVAVGGVDRPLDLLVDDTGAVVVNVVHLGVGARAAEQAAELKPRLGRLAYAAGAVRAGLRPPRLRLEVTVDGRPLADPHRPLLQVAIGSGRTVGGGTPLLPDADPGDRLLDVTVTAARGPLARLRYALRVRRGRHREEFAVASARGRSVTVVVPAGGPAVDVVSDGELGELAGARTWTVRPAAWRLLVP
jgi:diacylglycerol kinase family enzyme